MAKSYLGLAYRLWRDEVEAASVPPTHAEQVHIEMARVTFERELAADVASVGKKPTSTTTGTSPTGPTPATRKTKSKPTVTSTPVKKKTNAKSTPIKTTMKAAPIKKSRPTACRHPRAK